MTSKQLYLAYFGSRERKFVVNGNDVEAIDDSGGFVVASVDWHDSAPLIAQLLNELHDKSKVHRGPTS